MTEWRRRRDVVVSELVDAVFPKRCAGCGRRGGWVCAACAAAFLPYAPPWCERCGIPSVGAGCRCSTLADDLDRVRSYGPYDGWLGSAIRLAKYDGEWARIDHLAEMLSPIALASWSRSAVLVPVPLHAGRHRQRGYNQSSLLARAMGRRTGHPVVNALVRQRSTLQQVGLDAEQRRRNVFGAFAETDALDLDGQQIVLVDDVVTTGSTLAACAAVLRAAGAAGVSAMTLAGERGAPGSIR